MAMNGLVMGECSQQITIAMRAKGHNFFSVDLQPCYGGRPQWHIQGDMWEAFYRLNDSVGLDMVIVHIECTYMCNSGVLRLYKQGKKENGIDNDRWVKMLKSVDDFNRALALPVDKLILENPIMHRHARERINKQYSQTIQPYEYGHAESKRTCLWLKGVPLLKPTNILTRPECGYWDNQCVTGSGQNKLGKGKSNERSKTYLGWALAMAEQWG